MNWFTSHLSASSSEIKDATHCYLLMREIILSVGIARRLQCHLLILRHAWFTCERDFTLCPSPCFTFKATGYRTGSVYLSIYFCIGIPTVEDVGRILVLPDIRGRNRATCCNFLPVSSLSRRKFAILVNAFFILYIYQLFVYIKWYFDALKLSATITDLLISI